MMSLGVQGEGPPRPRTLGLFDTRVDLLVAAAAVPVMYAALPALLLWRKARQPNRAKP